jgi:GT2 family glycosyltransferase
MITIGYSTRLPNPKFKEYLEKTTLLKNIQVIEKVNMGRQSLPEVYNEILKESLYDIVVLCHDDIKLETGWGVKLLNDFQMNSDYGIIGKAGTAYFPVSGIYWEKLTETMAGQVYHQPENEKKNLSKYSAKLPFLIPVISVDGLFIAVRKSMIKHNFDESIGGFHFYDHSFCISNFLEGVKIGVTSSFDITHQSLGKPNEQFFEKKDEFLKKYGKYLPLDIKPTEIYVDPIKIKPIKNSGKVAVIILTKGKIDLLIQCINSLISYCDSNIYEIFVADTGSTDDEKKEFKFFIEENKEIIKINIIEYDYYNFGKINNDVVRNHIDESFEYILFCNNDIKILNNVILGMLNVFKTYSNTGTVGCRLHYGDNTVQHDGMVGIIGNGNKVDISHIGLRSYYKYSPYIKKVLGNTGALLMIRKNTFKRCGYFNEEYTSCFEDVELNLICLLSGYENYNDGSLVAYHFESQSRNDDPEDNNKLQYDFDEHLYPFIIKNIKRLKPRFIIY